MRWILIVFLSLTQWASAADFGGNVAAWREDKEVFREPEKNFAEVVKRLRANFVDRALSDEEIYRAAAAGVLAALNSGKQDEPWNALFSPKEAEDLKIELSGQLTGIGATLDFDKESGMARILKVLPESAALKAGLKDGDRILTVEGARFKDLRAMVARIRGPAGKSVRMKVLREDRVIDFTVTRAAVRMREVESARLSDGTAWLGIEMFTSKTPALVEKKLKDFSGVSRLIVDLRWNSGGSFEDAVRVAEIFLPKDAVIVRTRDKHDKAKETMSKNPSPWAPSAEIVLLVNGATASGAELVAGALRDARKARVVGTETFGKWNAQSLEELPNGFLMKYTVMRFESPAGFDGRDGGLKPDLMVESPKESWALTEMTPKKRLEVDPPLKAALSLGR